MNDALVPGNKQQPSSTLRLRVISACILGPIAISALWFGGWIFWALIMVSAIALAWEWGRLADLGTRLTAVHMAAAAAALTVAILGNYVLALAFFVVGMIFGFVFARPLDRSPWWSAGGMLYLIPPCLALLWLRIGLADGLAIVAWLFFAIWATDIAAYFIGRAVGGPRLAPRFSPNKTWAGLIGGVGAAALVGALFAMWFGFNQPLIYGLLAMAVAVLSQIGDLVESSIKRHFGVKDSSGLIPGHGGVLDRLDGMLFVAPAVALTLIMWRG